MSKNPFFQVFIYHLFGPNQKIWALHPFTTNNLTFMPTDIFSGLNSTSFRTFSPAIFSYPIPPEKIEFHSYFKKLEEEIIYIISFRRVESCNIKEFELNYKELEEREFSK
jgi:hypothetical protein